MPDHVDMLIAMARGSVVATVGRDEILVREYIRSQEAEDKRLD